MSVIPFGFVGAILGHIVKKVQPYMKHCSERNVCYSITFFIVPVMTSILIDVGTFFRNKAGKEPEEGTTRTYHMHGRSSLLIAIT